jgi:hypothetical protein
LDSDEEKPKIRPKKKGHFKTLEEYQIEYDLEINGN